jgi:phosphoribosylanthranilate isomerase
MTRIKVCGITNPEDAEAAAQCGADALGFVFAKSPRRIDPEQAREIIAALGPYVTAVGVFVNTPPDEAREVLEFTGCTVAQLHGDEEANYVDFLSPYAVVKAFRVGEDFHEAILTPYRRARAILLDTYVEGLLGGTGQRFETRVAAGLAVRGWRVIVAGGLNPGNVAEVVQAVQPYGVDVSSGVESAPGRKDHAKMREFVAAVRAADAR